MVKTMIRASPSWIIPQRSAGAPAEDADAVLELLEDVGLRAGPPRHRAQRGADPPAGEGGQREQAGGDVERDEVAEEDEADGRQHAAEHRG